MFLRQVLKGVWIQTLSGYYLKGDDVYIKRMKQLIGTDHTLLSQEAKRLYLFTKGGDNTISNTKEKHFLFKC